ncbi:S24 family peptidase [Chromobacterium haemolyticum]|nr:S24 family peptidase [Chromobacterium haemolyticum]
MAGDAMDGVLNDGDLALINRAETQPGSGLYALELDGEVVVRRAQRLPGGKLGLSSANEAYPPFEVDLAAPPADFSVLGRASGVAGAAGVALTPSFFATTSASAPSVCRRRSAAGRRRRSVPAAPAVCPR